MSPFFRAAAERSWDVVVWEEGEKWIVATAVARREVVDLEAMETILASPVDDR